MLRARPVSLAARKAAEPARALRDKGRGGTAENLHASYRICGRV